jgi:hypothetical protein
VYFRGWPQGREADKIRIDFGDGTVVEPYEPYAELTHAFETPGLHIVTATVEAAGFPVTQKVKVVVGE